MVQTQRGSEPVPVLFIGGNGRSGSTLVERILDQLPGWSALGETCHLVKRGLLDDQLCACNRPFSECPFWQGTGRRMAGNDEGWDSFDPLELDRLQRSIDRTRFVARNLANHAGLSSAPDHIDWYRTLSRFYRAAASEAEADVLIDSSKHLSTASVLANVNGIDLRILHLVRDSRGVARSWTKEVVRPEITNQVTYMPQYHPARPSGRWMFDNSGFEVLEQRGVPTLRVRYESFLEQPKETVAEIFRFARPGSEVPDLSFIEQGTVDLASPSHSVAGNPMRFEQGRLTLRLDEAWRTELEPNHRRLVTAITAPLLHRYGYDIKV